ncbi:MAG: hypothetical protein H2184_13220 [Candidatus Galacturonibacter soehngenii]|nr:hypothetical protein [Candidatus Galacturonibacter soehngenii]
MRKKDFRGAKCVKRYIEKCEDVCKTYSPLQYDFTDLLNESEDIISFRCNVLLEGLAEGEYTSDIVATKQDGNLMVRECVDRNKLTRPLTAKMLDMSRDYWKLHGIIDWGIVIEKEGAADEEG